MVINCIFEKEVKFSIDTEKNELHWDLGGYKRVGELRKTHSLNNQGEPIVMIHGGYGEGSYCTPSIDLSHITDCDQWERIKELFIHPETKLKKLAHDLTNKTFIPNQYFEVGTLLLVNISLGEDRAQEYEVYKQSIAGDYYKFESLTVSWINEERLRELLIKYERTPISKMNNPITEKPLEEKPLRYLPKERFELYKIKFEEFARVF